MIFASSSVEQVSRGYNIANFIPIAQLQEQNPSKILVTGWSPVRNTKNAEMGE